MKTRRRTSGQTLIEFALIFPLLIFLITGLFDLGRAVVYQASLNTAVREGSRYAIVLPYATSNRDNNIIAEAKKFLWVKDLQDNTTFTINYDIPDKPAPTDDARWDPRVIIDASYEFEPITPGVKLIIGGTGNINLTANSTMLLTPMGKPMY
jgi:Flp pilus assembly protein TadG